jgi:hypothetical protein
LRATAGGPTQKVWGKKRREEEEKRNGTNEVRYAASSIRKVRSGDEAGTGFVCYQSKNQSRK